MKNKNTCNTNNYKRVRYFHGQLLTDRDFREEQIYHNEKRKLLNRMLHGWGVVCGLGIKLESENPKITIKPGMALDCHGNEIVVCEPYEVDISSLPCQGKKTQQEQPECEEREKTNGQSRVFYIGIRYHEVPTDPVPVYAPGGGCEERVCDYSRTREGFCIELSESFPQPQQCSWGSSLAERVLKCRKTTDGNGEIDYPEDCVEKVITDFEKEFCHESACCPDCCPCEHYVILGTLHYSFENKTFKVDPNQERQYVLTVPFFKYLFSTLFTGAENILTDLVDEFKDGEVPDVNLLHQNPIAALCWLTKTLLLEREEQAAAEDARVVKGLSLSKANAQLEKEYQVLGTVTLSAANRKELLTLSSNVKDLKKNDAVEIVLDDKKKAIFYVPAREKVELKVMREEIAELRKKVQG